MLNLEDRLINFMQGTAGTLGRIETHQENMQRDLSEIRPKVEKIPLIERGLNNHLESHNTLSRYFLWPTTVGVLGGVVLGLLKYVFRVF